MFTEETLEEIRQWRQRITPPSEQLDRRWVERYRKIDAFDAYWWWAQAGPFTEEEQQQWNQFYSPDIDEATKERLGKLVAQSRKRELIAAIAEQREPSLHYPALDIEAASRRVVEALQLDAEISQEEPNEVVQRLYHGVLEQEVNFISLFKATHEGDNKRFWHLSQSINPIPSLQEMEVALAGVRRVLLQGLQSADTREVSDRLVQFLHERLDLSLDLSSSVEENQQSQYITSTSSSQEPRMVTTQVVKRFFEAVLHEGGYDSWQVAIDPKTSGARIESGLRQLFLPDTSLSVSRIRHLLAHELAGHVARSFAGECSSLGLLGMNTKGLYAD